MTIQHVLLVEDNAAFSEALQELLRRSGLSVSSAETIDEAERMFRAIPVDAVLLDATLGAERLNSVCLLKQIRGDGFKGPIIAISGSGEQNDVLCENGANIGILKIRCQQIVDAVKRF